MSIHDQSSVVDCPRAVSELARRATNEHPDGSTVGSKQPGDSSSDLVRPGWPIGARERAPAHSEASDAICSHPIRAF
jgi:hypothetical protein